MPAMPQPQGITSQGNHIDLIKRLEELRSLRQELNQQVDGEEAKIRALIAEIRNQSDSLAILNEALAKKLAARVEVDKTIIETELSYAKILEKSQNLIGVLKKEIVVTAQKPSNL